MHRAMGNAEAKCPACVGPDAETIRKLYRCDLPHTFGEPVPQEYRVGVPSVTITCTLCAGRDGDCPVCLGSGEERVFRCAGSLSDADTNEFLGLWGDYQQGILPDAGGMSDQAAPFVELVRVAEAERGAIMAEERKERERRKR